MLPYFYTFKSFFMTITEAVEILKYFNKWRRGAEIPQPDAKKVGEAIDIAIKALDNLPN